MDSVVWSLVVFVALLAVLATYAAFVHKGQADGGLGEELPSQGNIVSVAGEILDLYRVVLVFVRSAERLGGSTGAEKLAWVVEQVKALDDYFDLDADWLRKIIEGAVEEVKPQSSASLPANFPGEWNVLTGAITDTGENGEASE